MNWKNQLSKTPYFILFIVLFTVGVGTASALVTITLAGDVIITDDLTVDGHANIQNGATILDHVTVGDGITTSTINAGMIDTNSLAVGTNNENNDDFIYFDDGSKSLKWDDSIHKFSFNGFLNLDEGSGLFDAIFFNDEGQITYDNQSDNFFISAETNIEGPIHTGVGLKTAPYNTMGFAGFTNHGLDDPDDLFISENLEVDGIIFSDAGCIGCMDFYEKSHPSLVAGLNDLSCNNGDPVINGGGWSTSTTHWIRESWAFDTDTWRLSMTDVNGNNVAPGEFKITCADLNPNDGP